MPYLIYTSEDGGEAIELDVPCRISIGRTAENDVVILNDASVSRRHCLLTLLEDGSATIEDLGSRNGTTLNSQTIDRSSAPLNDGDAICVGSAHFVFCRDNPEAFLDRLEPAMPVKLVVKGKKKDADSLHLSHNDQIGQLIDIDTVKIERNEPVKTSKVEISSFVKGTEISTGDGIGPYMIIRKLGEGCFSKVFLAYQKSMDRTVALKIFNLRSNIDEAFSALKRDLSDVSSLDHPGLLHYFDCGCDANHIYLSMPYLSEGTVFDRLRSRTRFPLETASRIILQLTEALESILKISGKAHLGVCPSNVAFDENDNALLCDYGIKPWQKRFCSKSQSAPAHSRYESPELKEGDDFDHLSDIYSLGVLFFDMLCGLPGLDNEFARSRELKNLKAPLEIRELIKASTESSKKMRIQSYEAMTKILRRSLKYLDNSPVGTKRPPEPGGTRQAPRKIVIKVPPSR